MSLRHRSDARTCSQLEATACQWDANKQQFMRACTMAPLTSSLSGKCGETAGTLSIWRRARIGLGSGSELVATVGSRTAGTSLRSTRLSSMPISSCTIAWNVHWLSSGVTGSSRRSTSSSCGWQARAHQDERTATVMVTGCYSYKQTPSNAW